MPKKLVEFVTIRGSKHNYEVLVYFKNVKEPKVFTLWTWSDYDDEPNGLMPYICTRDCKEVYLNDLVNLGEFTGLWECIDCGGYVWINSDKLKGQEL